MANKKIRQIAEEIKLVIFDFDGVFTDNKVIVHEDGSESVVCNRADGIGLSRLRQLGIDLLILSTEQNEVIKYRARKLNINCINNCVNKLDRLLSEIKKRKLSLNQVAFVGNDINDLECLKIVGFPVVVANSHRDVLRYGKYKTRLSGGNGAVREVCDFIASVLREGGKFDAQSF